MLKIQQEVWQFMLCNCLNLYFHILLSDKQMDSTDICKQKMNISIFKCIYMLFHCTTLRLVKNEKGYVLLEAGKWNIKKYSTCVQHSGRQMSSAVVCDNNFRQGSIYRNTTARRSPQPCSRHMHIKWLISEKGSNYKQAETWQAPYPCPTQPIQSPHTHTHTLWSRKQVNGPTRGTS